jgi:glutamyl-tRNA synthetase
MTTRTTRLAPSPTGTLHLGNARTFLVNWALARQANWRIIMRIEDLDLTRVRPGAAESLLRTLEWLGIDYDDGPVYQSHDLKPYRDAVRKLTDLKMAYACALTRAQVLAAASAPHAGESETRFPPDLRPTSDDAYRFHDDHTNYRFVVPPQTICIHDQFAGSQHFSPHEEVGDFIIWTKTGMPAYQLAVVVDDARHGVTDVVRGDDLLPSAARQTLLYRELTAPEPRWWHLPLVLGPDGRRLAKRDQSTHLEHYQHQGVRPERIIGLLAHWCGLTSVPREMSIADFLQTFRIDTLSREPVRFTPADHEWLLQKC